MSVNVLVLVYYVCISTALTQELLNNGDFENQNSVSPWTCNDCTATIVQAERYHGHNSINVTNRHHDWSGISQTISVQGGQYIKFSGYIKIPHIGQDKMYTSVSVMAHYQANGKEEYHGIYYNHYQQADNIWMEVGGDIHVPNGINSLNIYIQVADPSVNYLFDYASCEYITHDSQWKTKANQRIENIRKGTLEINIETNGQVLTNGISVQIKQTKSQFGFGTAFAARLITDSSHAAYQNFIYKNFEWGVPENALKWRQMEWTKGNIDYDTGMNAVRKLREHGIKVRGHNMFWDVGEFIPAWLKGMSSSQILQEMHTRVDGMMSLSQGTLEHWDVNNENLHGHIFEDLTKHADINAEIFKWMHAKDPNVKLFLNEYNVVAWSESTTAYKSQGKKLKDDGVPIYGMGVQGHFGSSNINMDVIKYRLDKVAESGLPIWVTELSIQDGNENTKAAALNDVMTMFFSHSAVEGVLLWGFWDGAIYDKNNSLATGDNVTPNAAGRKWQELFHQRFRTNVSRQFDGHTTLQERVFKGEYQILIQYHSKTIHTETINVHQDHQRATVHLQGTGDNVQVSHIAFG